MTTTQQTFRIVAVAATVGASAMLLYALFAAKAPYAFYQNMRVVIAVATVLDCIALLGTTSWRRWLSVPAVIFAYVHLTQRMPKENWRVWNLAALVCFGIIGALVVSNQRKTLG